MTEPYNGNVRRYAGEDVDITYSLKRCIHAEHCVNHLSHVFDKQKRPWINANGAGVEQITSVIELCPSGALHYDRKDGLKEPIRANNVIKVWHNGPLEICGDLTISGKTLVIEQETRATLCRCGQSSNKPFCDNTHKAILFTAVKIDPIDKVSEKPGGGKLTISVQENGPLEFEGALEILNEAGETLFIGHKIRLCRCGGSNNKPFCDGTHQRNKFVAE